MLPIRYQEAMRDGCGDVNDVAGAEGVALTAGQVGASPLAGRTALRIDQRAAQHELAATTLNDHHVDDSIVLFGTAVGVPANEAEAVVPVIPQRLAGRSVRADALAEGGVPLAQLGRAPEGEAGRIADPFVGGRAGRIGNLALHLPSRSFRAGRATAREHESHEREGSRECGKGYSVHVDALPVMDTRPHRTKGDATASALFPSAAGQTAKRSRAPTPPSRSSSSAAASEISSTVPPCSSARSTRCSAMSGRDRANARARMSVSTAPASSARSVRSGPRHARPAERAVS